MKKVSLLMIVLIAILMQCGCGSPKQSKTGYLTSYSRLTESSKSSLRYVNSASLNRYSSFMVDTVDVYFHHGSKAIELRSEGKLTQEDLDDLTNYMHNKITEAVRNSGKTVVYQPRAGTARIRAAITDVSTSDLKSLLPPARVIAKAGVGGTSMEAEIIDSMTGEQIAAIVESGKGSRVPLSDLGKWDSAKRVIDSWAKRLQERLE